MSLYDNIKETLENMDDEELVSIWNEYTTDPDDRIEPMYRIDELYADMKPSEFLSSLGSDFDINADYFKDGIYGLETVSDPRDEIDIDDLAAYITDTGTTFFNSELTDVFDEWEEENDNEDIA